MKVFLIGIILALALGAAAQDQPTPGVEELTQTLSSYALRLASAEVQIASLQAKLRSAQSKCAEKAP